MSSTVRCMVIFCVILWGGSALAECKRLSDTMALAEENLAIGGLPSAAAFQEMGLLIGDINNDATLAILRVTQQGHEFSDLRNFLTQLKFITRNMTPDQVNLTEKFFADLNEAARIVREACILPDGSVRPDIVTNAAAQGSGERALGVSSLNVGSHYKTVPVRSRTAAFEDYNLGLLATLLVGSFVAVLCLISLHIAIIAVRVLYRGRKVCDVPVTIEFLGKAVEARIKMIGVYGCVLIPPADAQSNVLAGLSEGTYCRVVLPELMINARVMRDPTETCDLWFSEKLTRSDLRNILDHAEDTPRYDFGILRTAHQRGLTFGVGRLPFK